MQTDQFDDFENASLKFEDLERGPSNWTIVSAGREKEEINPVECYFWNTVLSFAQICSGLDVSFHVHVFREHAGMAEHFCDF